MEWLLVLVVLWVILIAVCMVMSTVVHRDGDAQVVGLVGSAVLGTLLVGGFVIALVAPTIDRMGLSAFVLWAIAVAVVIAVAERLGARIGSWVARHRVAAVCAAGLAFAAVSVAYVLMSEG